MKIKESDIVGAWRDPDQIVATICCTTYNHENYLEDAIEGFLIQKTDFAFEIFIHDDASTDSTPQIIKRYTAAYPRIIRSILQSENQYSKAGLILPRFVFPAAAGRYLAICEGDDFWIDKYKLQKQVDFLEKNPEYVITYTACQPFDRNGLLEHAFKGVTTDLTEEQLKKTASIATLTTCFRNVIAEVPSDLLAARYGDMVIWSLLGHYGKGKFLSDISPSAYRVHDKGLHSTKSQIEQAKMRLITISALHAYYVRQHNELLARYFRIRILFTLLQTMGFTKTYRLARFVSNFLKSLSSRKKPIQ